MKRMRCKNCQDTIYLSNKVQWRHDFSGRKNCNYTTAPNEATPDVPEGSVFAYYPIECADWFAYDNIMKGIQHE